MKPENINEYLRRLAGALHSEQADNVWALDGTLNCEPHGFAKWCEGSTTMGWYVLVLPSDPEKRARSQGVGCTITWRGGECHPTVNVNHCSTPVSSKLDFEFEDFSDAEVKQLIHRALQVIGWLDDNNVVTHELRELCAAPGRLLSKDGAGSPTPIKLRLDDGVKRSVYLAAPYRGSAHQIAERMSLVSNVFQAVRTAGHFVTSPLLHHYTFGTIEEANDGEYWLAYSKHLVTAFATLEDSEYVPEVWVLDVPGWQESSGVTLEREVAHQYGIAVRLMKIADGELREVIAKI